MRSERMMGLLAVGTVLQLTSGCFDPKGNTGSKPSEEPLVIPPVEAPDTAAGAGLLSFDMPEKAELAAPTWGPTGRNALDPKAAHQILLKRGKRLSITSRLITKGARVVLYAGDASQEMKAVGSDTLGFDTINASDHAISILLTAWIPKGSTFAQASPGTMEDFQDSRQKRASFFDPARPTKDAARADIRIE